jgi:hypothetical protein
LKSTKHTGITKPQHPITREISNIKYIKFQSLGRLEFGDSLDVGAWNLVIHWMLVLGIW